MNRYRLISGEVNAFMRFDDRGMWCEYSDAEVEIEKARREGHDIPCHWCAQARADERQRIIQTLNHMAGLETDANLHVINRAIKTIRAPAPDPKPHAKLEYIPPASPQSSDHYKGVVNSINSIVDAFNSLQDWLRKP